MTRARAFAKLTVSLHVLGVRPDGFHELEALAVSLGQPHDVVEVAPAAEPGVRLTVVADDASVPRDGDNLVARAADALLARAGTAAGAEVALTKRIPAGAGLGGGSADAAATLVAVREALGIDVDDAALDAIAAELGSDVPFCLRGGAAWMRGRGERLEALPVALGLPFLLATPPVRCATAAVYAAWDELGGPRSERAIPSPPALAGLVTELRNDLEPAAARVAPELVELRERLEAAAGRPAILAGSGSTYAVPMEDAAELPRRAVEVSERLGAPVVPAATVSRGVRLL